MRNVLLGVVLGAALVLGASLYEETRRPLHAQTATSARGPSGGELIVVVTSEGDQHRQLAVVDAALRTMAIYHVERQHGGVELKSVRNFTWDLQMPHYNGAHPLPDEIRAMMQQR